jgi:hypothetical protein
MVTSLGVISVQRFLNNPTIYDIWHELLKALSNKWQKKKRCTLFNISVHFVKLKFYTMRRHLCPLRSRIHLRLLYVKKPGSVRENVAPRRVYINMLPWKSNKYYIC